MTKTRITNRIKELRQASGPLTQEQLAALVGITRQTVIALEAEKYAPSLELAFKIARVFSVSVEDVFIYPDEPAPANPPAPR
ncbi:MAG TPA: helix-turn-helix transcriptional regulator [Herpetosiphonaceae bacterium]